MTNKFRSPLDMFYHWESTRPESIWLRQPREGLWVDYTWQQVGCQARRLAEALRGMGLNHGDRVGICAQNSAEWIVTDLAIMMAGGVSVPIYTTMPKDKISYVIDHSEMKFLFVDGSGELESPEFEVHFGDVLDVIALNTVNMNHQYDELIASTPPMNGNPTRELNELWSIIYTSGTTGMPKGVKHSFYTAPFSASEIPDLSKTNENSRFFSYLPLAHMAERSVVELHSLYCGAVIGFNRDKDTFINDLLEIQPTFFLAVPRIWTKLKAGIIADVGDQVWKQCLRCPETAKKTGGKALTALGLSDVTFAFTGTAPIPEEDIMAWKSLGMPICEGFSQSETMSGTANRPDDYKIGSVGKPMSKSAEVMISAAGEILLRSPGNMLGYLNEPQKTTETIQNGWIHTGDKGFIDSDGFLFVTGRVKDIFKTAKGKYVAPVPIESKFSSLAGIEQCCLVGRGLPQTVMLAVFPSTMKYTDELDYYFKNHLDTVNNGLEAHERISRFIVCSETWSIENGLLTHTLKLLRDSIEQHYGPLIKTALNDHQSVIFWENYT